jgi:nitroreductase
MPDRGAACHGWPDRAGIGHDGSAGKERMMTDDSVAAVDEAITSRRSIRGFLPDPVPAEVIRRLIALAGRAPSGTNIQPWKVHVLTGAVLGRVTAALGAAFAAGEPEARDYVYYPETWRSPYLERRRQVGLQLYGLVGVARGDRDGAARQTGRNFTFFGAPVGLVFTIDRDLEQGSWLDYGMFLQTLMIAARARGLDTCAQAAIANYPAILRRHLGIPETEAVVCGMALGHADRTEPANALVAEREPVDGFTTFHDG